MKVDIIELYKSIFQAQGINFMLYDEKFHLIDGGNERPAGKIYQNDRVRQFSEEIMEQVNGKRTIIYADAFSVSYCVFAFPEVLRREYLASYVVIGPVLFQAVKRNQIMEVFEKYKIELMYLDEFMVYCNSLPKLPSRDYWISLLTPMIKMILGENVEFEFQDIQDQNQESMFPINTECTEESIVFEMIKERYEVEMEVMQAVCRGDRFSALRNFDKFKRYNIMPRTSDEIRNLKNWGIVLNTVLRKSVGMVKVHPYYLDQLSTEFAIKIESTNDLNRLEHLMENMIKRYCLLVHNHSIASYSAVVSKTIEYIKFHYTENITLEQLAENCTVSMTYLSSIFKKETSVTITDYINNIRVEHAIFLLNSSDDSITEIAMKSGYNDANYFSRMFKRIKGMTPNEYRRQIQK